MTQIEHQYELLKIRANRLEIEAKNAASRKQYIRCLNALADARKAINSFRAEHDLD